MTSDIRKYYANKSGNRRATANGLNFFLCICFTYNRLLIGIGPVRFKSTFTATTSYTTFIIAICIGPVRLKSTFSATASYTTVTPHCGVNINVNFTRTRLTTRGSTFRLACIYSG